jgi:hypothetical protein
MAPPPWRETLLTLCSWKAAVLALSWGTTVDLVPATVDAADACAHATVIEFRLLANSTLELRDRRDQPSGTLMVNWPVVDRYGTKTVVSGMSPGGLLSAGTGD